MSKSTKRDGEIRIEISRPLRNAARACAAAHDQSLREFVIGLIADAARQEQPALWRQWRQKQIEREREESNDQAT